MTVDIPAGIRVGVDDFNTVPAEQDAAKFTTLTAAELCAQPDPEGHALLGPIVGKGGRTIIVGATGHGKTTLGLQLLRAVTEAGSFCDWTGAGNLRGLVIDLEQGAKSARRALREAGLGNSENVDVALIPDGLALDRNPEHVQQLHATIALGGHEIVLLDPYYKAHQAEDPNSERPIVDLMRQLDALRTQLGFSLILPAHPRKRQDQEGPRKLTIDDISGSGAVSRGAEVVIGIERLNPGYARLRFLKDRDGDLPVGEAWSLTFTKTAGYQRDPRDTEPAHDDYPELIRRVSDGEWHTVREYMELASVGERAVRKALATLVARDEYEHAEGPPGRQRTAKCWRPLAASDTLMHPDAPRVSGSLATGNTATASGDSPPYRESPVDAVQYPAATSDAEDAYAAFDFDANPFDAEEALAND